MLAVNAIGINSAMWPSVPAFTSLNQQSLQASSETIILPLSTNCAGIRPQEEATIRFHHLLSQKRPAILISSSPVCLLSQSSYFLTFHSPPWTLIFLSLGTFRSQALILLWPCKPFIMPSKEHFASRTLSLISAHCLYIPALCVCLLQPS